MDNDSLVISFGQMAQVPIPKKQQVKQIMFDFNSLGSHFELHDQTTKNFLVFSTKKIIKIYICLHQKYYRCCIKCIWSRFIEKN